MRRLMFIVCLVAVGITSREYAGTDGPLVILVGLAIVCYTLVASGHPTRSPSILHECVVRSPVIFVVLGLLVAVAGLADTFCP
jgi:hypothetical protein